MKNKDLFDSDFWKDWTDPAGNKAALLKEYMGLIATYKGLGGWRMTEKQKLLVQGMDMLLKKFNVFPNEKEFTVEEIIEKSNEVYKEILGGNRQTEICMKCKDYCCGEQCEKDFEEHFKQLRKGNEVWEN